MSSTTHRLRRGLWGISVLLVSSVAGLVLSAALWGPPGRSRALRFTGFAAAGTFARAAAAALPRLPPGSSLVAHVHAASVRVYRDPNDARHERTVRALSAGGRTLPLILLVLQRRSGWLRVELPVRPNLSSGWIRSRRVSVHDDPYRVSVALAAHELTVWRGAQIVTRRRIGVGQAVSPTPSGRYYITDALRPPDPHGLYGPYALGLSAYSPVYTTFAGGHGQIGLHGTNDPAGLGHNVSHGCIRVDNPTITQLARILPIGTPVVIHR